ncbi:MAG: TraB/GumN family protein [Chitinophagaceae bacterium]|nr:TraB/GumN family protein [Chitinophagaceae bacterium]
MKKIIKESKKIYFEIDMDDREQMMGALKYVRMNDGVKLSDLLTKEEFERVDAYFKKNFQIPCFNDEPL